MTCQGQEGPRLRVCVRRLPPWLSTESFLDLIIEWREYLQDYSYIQGKQTLFPGKTSLSVAYLKFSNQTHLLSFYREFDGRIFKEGDGNLASTPVYKSIVEYAPFQETGKTRRDPLIDTFSQGIFKELSFLDLEYLNFISVLKESVEDIEKITCFGQVPLKKLRDLYLAEHDLKVETQIVQKRIFSKRLPRSKSDVGDMDEVVSNAQRLVLEEKEKSKRTGTRRSRPSQPQS